MIGKHGRDIVEKWRRDGGSLSIPVPQCDMRINVVDRYRHLGTIVMANGNDVPNARLGAKSAKEACGPLAFVHFFLGLDTFLLHKLSLYMSLVESRNSFSMHIAPPSFQRASDCCFCVQPALCARQLALRVLRETSTR